MYKYILFAILYFITIFSYYFTKKKYFSPTFISSLMFTIFSATYIIFYEHMGRDILPITMWSIVLSEVAILFGEIFADGVILKKVRKSDNYSLYKQIIEINISKKFTIVLSIIILITGLLRLLRLREIYGGSMVKGLSVLITSVRGDSVLGLISFGPVLSALYYVSLCAAYVYAFIFVQKLFVVKRIEIIYLLPVFSYCICVISTTSRSEFIKLACAFISAVFLCNIFHKKKKINFFKAGVFACVFILFFLWYGFAVRGITFSGSNSIWSNVVGYSCASIYGLDEYLRSAHIANELFGKYTFEYIYSLFGKEILNTIEKTYTMAIGHSNIYTALTKPIQDFGIFGMIIEKFIVSFLSVKLINKCINMEFSTNKFYFMFIIVAHIIYVYLMEPVGEKSSYLYFNPGYLIRIIVAFLVLIIVGFRVQYQFENGVLISTNLRRS